jgi:tetratricopeptide (TPR) repeat protein
LTRREVLRFEAHPRSPERGQYSFVQSLIREVAYNTLARSDRRARHLAAARYFEGIGGDELAGALARHYLAAYENSPAGPEAEALAAQARIALRGAGDRAAALGSHRQASAFYEQALAVASEPSEQAEILLRSGESLLADGDAEGQSRLERAVELRRSIGEPGALANAITSLAKGQLSQFQPSQAIPLLEAARIELESVSGEPPGITLRSQLARAYMMAPDNTRALEMCDQVLVDAERANVVEVIADTLITRGTVLAQLWRPREGMGAIRAGTDLAEQEGLHWIALRGLNNQASTMSEVDPRAAVEVAPRGIALAARLGQRPLSRSLINISGSAHFKMGDWQVVVDLLERARADELDAGARTELQTRLTWIHALRGQPVDSEVAEELEVLQRSGEYIQQTAVHDLNSVVAFARGDLDRARREARTSNDMEPYPFIMAIAMRADLWLGDLEAARADLAALDSIGAHGPLPDAERLVFAAGVAALQGERGEALRLYRDGRRSLREFGIKFMLALSGIDMALLLPGEADTADAIVEARAILTEIAAAPLIERLEAAAASAVPASNSAASARSGVPAG